MAHAPPTILRFLADHAELLLTLFERGEVALPELHALVARGGIEDEAQQQRVLLQVQDLGILEPCADADAVFELARPVVDLLAWLTGQQRLSSAQVLQAYLGDLERMSAALDGAVRAGDVATAALALRDGEALVERLRQLAEGNRDAILTESQTLRSQGPDVSVVHRFETVRWLWERYLEPMRQLVDVRGEMEQRLDRVRAILAEGEQRFLAHGPVQRAFARLIARLARMRRTTAEAHHAAVVEIAPLYEQLRRDSRWVLGASAALGRIRTEGAGALDLDRQMGLVGWRPRFLMADAQLRSRLLALVGYQPGGPTTITAPEPLAPILLIPREALYAVLAAQVPVPDVLELILAHWPQHTLATQIRAFGLVACGGFGPVAVAGSGPRRYPIPGGCVEAWPLALESLAS